MDLSVGMMHDTCFFFYSWGAMVGPRPDSAICYDPDYRINGSRKLSLVYLREHGELYNHIHHRHHGSTKISLSLISN